MEKEFFVWRIGNRASRRRITNSATSKLARRLSVRQSVSSSGRHAYSQIAAGSERSKPWASAQRLICQKTLFESH